MPSSDFKSFKIRPDFHRYSLFFLYSLNTDMEPIRDLKIMMHHTSQDVIKIIVPDGANGGTERYLRSSHGDAVVSNYEDCGATNCCNINNTLQ